METRDILKILRERKMVIMVTAIVTFVLLVLASQLSKPRYVSHARLVINPPSPMTTGTNGGNPTSSNDWMNDYKVLNTLMTSKAFLQQVIDNSKLPYDWETLSRLMEVRQVAASAKTTILEVKIVGSTSQQAQSTCLAIVNSFTDYVPGMAAAEYKTNREFLENLMNEAKSRLQKAEDAVSTWQQKHQTLDINSSATAYAASLNKLIVERDEALQKIADQKNRISLLQAFLDGKQTTVPWALVDPNNKQASADVDLGVETARLERYKATYKPGDPALVGQQNVVDNLRLHTLEKNQAEVRSALQEQQTIMSEATNHLAATNRSIAELKKSWSLAQNNLEYLRLSRQATSLHQNYEDMYNQWSAARIAEKQARREGSIQVLETPGPGVAVHGFLGDPLQTLPLVVPLCLAVGIAAAFGVDRVTRGLRVQPHIEEALGVPVMGTIPVMPRYYTQLWERLRGEVEIQGIDPAVVWARKPRNGGNGQGRDPQPLPHRR